MLATERSTTTDVTRSTANHSGETQQQQQGYALMVFHIVPYTPNREHYICVVFLSSCTNFYRRFGLFSCFNGEGDTWNLLCDGRIVDGWARFIWLAVVRFELWTGGLPCTLVANLTKTISFQFRVNIQCLLCVFLVNSPKPSGELAVICHEDH